MVREGRSSSELSCAAEKAGGKMYHHSFVEDTLLAVLWVPLLLKLLQGHQEDCH